MSAYVKQVRNTFPEMLLYSIYVLVLKSHPIYNISSQSWLLPTESTSSVKEKYLTEFKDISGLFP